MQRVQSVKKAKHEMFSRKRGEEKGEKQRKQGGEEYLQVNRLPRGAPGKLLNGCCIIIVI